jgi:hypothetical protein
MEPRLEEWSAAFEAAVAFRDLAPWRWCWDADVFGVEDPESGVTGYCCIMGNLGEHFALGLYRGSEGLAGFWEMQLAGRQPEEERDPVTLLSRQDAVMVSFEDRKLLAPRDLELIKRLGMKFRGRHAWPQFRSYQPGYEPWYLAGPEVRFLTVALQQSIEVAGRLAEERMVLPPTRPGGQYLVRVPEREGPGWRWHDVVREAPPPVRPPRPLPAIDEGRLRRMGEQLARTDGILELGWFSAPEAVWGEGEDRPYFPEMLLAADSASGAPFGVRIAGPGQAVAILADTFLDLIEQMGMLPARVIVDREEAFFQMEPLAARLEIRLVQLGRLGAVEYSRDSLFAHLLGEELEALDEDEE